MKRNLLGILTVILYGSLVMTVVSCSKDDDSGNPDPGAEFKALLKTLDWGSDTCFVYGHKTPDVDAVTSALSYAKLMNTLGYNCKAKVSSPMNRETQYIAKLFDFTLPTQKTSVVPQTRLILTDHTDYAQCVDGAREAIILQKIDHLIANTGSDKDVKPYIEDGTYFIYFVEDSQRVAEAVFGTSLREGVCFTTENLSRKQIVPRITEVL